MQKTIRILIADNHPVVRQGLRAVLETEADFSVVAEAGDGISAVELAKQHAPDVLIVDMMMPGINGTEVARRVRKLLPQTGIVIFSIYSDEAYVLEALKNGAHGYALKDVDNSELIEAVRRVRRGDFYLSPSFNQARIESFLQKAEEQEFDLYDMLTKRERDVFQLTAQGKTSMEIGEILEISPRTVEAHRNNLMRKLGIHSQTELVKYAIKRGIIRA